MLDPCRILRPFFRQINHKMFLTLLGLSAGLELKPLPAVRLREGDKSPRDPL
jgi:hypothetical protein